MLAFRQVGFSRFNFRPVSKAKGEQAMDAMPMEFLIHVLNVGIQCPYDYLHHEFWPQCSATRLHWSHRDIWTGTDGGGRAVGRIWCTAGSAIDADLSFNWEQAFWPAQARVTFDVLVLIGLAVA